MVGFFEPGAKPWAHGRHPGGVRVRRRCPRTGTTSRPISRWPRGGSRSSATSASRLFFNGPESFTPDDRYILGEAPELPGTSSPPGSTRSGFQSAGGAGQGAGRLDRRRPPADGPVGRRHPPVDAVPGQPPLPPRPHDRGARPALRHALAVPPGRDGARRATIAAPRPAGGARAPVFGEMAGWERANWYATGGIEPRYEY